MIYDNWEIVEVEELVKIPTLDGTATAETVPVKIKGYRNPVDGEVYFDRQALEYLDKVRKICIDKLKQKSHNH